MVQASPPPAKAPSLVLRSALKALRDRALLIPLLALTGKWEEKEKVTPDDAGQKINYGLWVAMSGNMVVVSSYAAPNEGGAEKGIGTAAYVYNSVDDFGVFPHAVEPHDMSLTTLGSVKRTALLQNFPNPFNPETWMPYRLASDAPVTIQIYNVQGQLLRELDLGERNAGSYMSRDSAAYWDGRDRVGQTVASGVLFLCPACRCIPSHPAHAHFEVGRRGSRSVGATRIVHRILPALLLTGQIEKLAPIERRLS